MSPQNVLVSVDSLAKLSDFGVSRAVDSVRRTKTGELKGKLAYMAPEQLQESFGAIDHRTDIWSAAVTIYECFIGVPLFRRPNDVDTMHCLLNDPIVPLREVRSDVPPKLAEALDKALDRHADKRTSEVAQLADALAAVCLELQATSQQVAAFLAELKAAKALPHVGVKAKEDARTEIVDRDSKKR